MIDIIIPAYNNRGTIINTLSSILSQVNIKDIKTTIVNDAGEDYKDIISHFSKYMDVSEISYKVNRGPGYARQYGIDHTNNEYIVFIDADDTFYGAQAVGLLTNPLETFRSAFVISPFIQYGKEIGQAAPVNANLTWVFGHAYRRKFIEKHKIKFTPTRANEDVGFNAAVNLIAKHELGEEYGKVLQAPTYEWRYNEVSITRKGKAEYANGICTPGFIYNTHHAYEVAQREGVTMKEIAEDAMGALFSCFIYYCVALQQKDLPKETLDSIETLSRKFFYDYYEQSKEFISEDEYKNIYTGSMNSKGDHLQGVIFKMTLDEFIELMFSKPVDKKSYAQIENEVQNVVQQD